MLDDEGREIPDNTPVVVRFRGRTISQFDQVRAYIRNELSRQAASLELETFEDANDFDVEDDLFPVSPHEYSADTEAADREALLAGDPSLKAKAPSGNPEGAAGGLGAADPQSLPVEGTPPASDAQ